MRFPSQALNYQVRDFHFSFAKGFNEGLDDFWVEVCSRTFNNNLLYLEL